MELVGDGHSVTVYSTLGWVVGVKFLSSIPLLPPPHLLTLPPPHSTAAGPITPWGKHPSHPFPKHTPITSTALCTYFTVLKRAWAKTGLQYLYIACYHNRDFPLWQYGTQTLTQTHSPTPTHSLSLPLSHLPLVRRKLIQCLEVP